MTTPQTRASYDEWIGENVYDSDDQKIGSIEDIFYDTQSRRPEWMAVKTGLFGMKRSFVPMMSATTYTDGDGEMCLRVPLTKAQVKDAPQIDPDGDALEPAEEQRLYQHYGLDYQNRTNTFGGNDRFDRDYKTNWDDRGDDNDVVATETVQNQTVQTQPEQVRLRKYHWTEQVPVQREEIRVEREPKMKK
jgi:hypothetical protein